MITEIDGYAYKLTPDEWEIVMLSHAKVDTTAPVWGDIHIDGVLCRRFRLLDGSIVAVSVSSVTEPAEPEKPELCAVCDRLWNKAPKDKRAEVAKLAAYRKAHGTVQTRHCVVCIIERAK